MEPNTPASTYTDVLRAYHDAHPAPPADTPLDVLGATIPADYDQLAAAFDWVLRHPYQFTWAGEVTATAWAGVPTEVRVMSLGKLVSKWIPDLDELAARQPAPAPSEPLTLDDFGTPRMPRIRMSEMTYDMVWGEHTRRWMTSLPEDHPDMLSALRTAYACPLSFTPNGALAALTMLVQSWLDIAEQARKQPTSAEPEPPVAAAPPRKDRPWWKRRT